MSTDTQSPATKAVNEKAESFAWQGTEPAKGTRRELVRDTINAFWGDHEGRAWLGGRDGAALAVADAIEAALLEGSYRSEGEGDRQTLKPSPIHAQLDRVSIARTDGSRVLALWERVELLVQRYCAHFDRLGADRNPDKAAVPASRAMEMLDEEGIPRVDGGGILTIDHRLERLLREGTEDRATDCLVRQVAVAMFAPLETDGFHPSASQEDEARRVIDLVEAGLRERLLSDEAITAAMAAANDQRDACREHPSPTQCGLEAALGCIGLNEEAVDRG